jgi:hypothetical protein
MLPIRCVACTLTRKVGARSQALIFGRGSACRGIDDGLHRWPSAPTRADGRRWHNRSAADRGRLRQRRGAWIPLPSSDGQGNLRLPE